MVLLVTSITMVTNDTLSCAVALSRVAIARAAVSVAEARRAIATVDWVAVVSCHAMLTMTSFGKMIAGLLTDIVGAHNTLAVAIALTIRARREVPMFFGTQRSHRIKVGSVVNVRVPGRALHAHSHASARSVITPTTARVLLTLVASLDVSAIKPGTLPMVNCPLHALSNRKDGRVSI